MGWRELSVKKSNKPTWLNHLRNWLLVVVVSWLAGWGLVEFTLHSGNHAQMASVQGSISRS